MSLRYEIALWVFFLAAVGVLGKFDYAADLELEAEEKMARPARVIAAGYEPPSELRRLSMPLECDATMRVQGPNEPWQAPRCYVRKHTQGER